MCPLHCPPPSPPRPCFLPIHSQCPVQNQCVWGVPTSNPRAEGAVNQPAELVHRERDGSACWGAGQQPQPPREPPWQELCWKSGCTAPSANSILYFHGQFLHPLPTLLFPLARLSLPSLLLLWCWAEVLDAGPAHKGILSDWEGALTQLPILSLPLDFYF